MTGADDPAEAFEVPTGVEAVTCPECGRPFVDEEVLALHRGRAHAEGLSGEPRAAFERALEAEETWLRRFRLKALGGLVLLYFALLTLYALV